MAERSYKVETRKIEYWCDQCDSSAMSIIDMPVRSEHPMWRYWCPSCNATVDLPYRYPVYRYEYMENQ